MGDRCLTGANRTAAAVGHPGDDAVDVTGRDRPCPTTESWRRALIGLGGLTAWSDWAGQHGKRVAITWAIGTDTTSTWVRNVHSFVELTATQKRVAYESTSIVGGNKDAIATYLKLW